MKAKRFEGELIQGHKGVIAVIVPFDPEAVFHAPPTRLAGRRHGWVVRASVEGIAFHGYIGERWGRFFVMLEPSVLERAGLELGQKVAMTVTLTGDAEAVAQAVEQSKRTTQPARARSDAVVAHTGTPTPRSRKRT